MTSSSNSLGGYSGGGSAPSASLRSTRRWNSGSGISLPISATVIQAATRAIASAPTSTETRSPSPPKDGGLSRSSARPVMTAISAAALSGGPNASLMQLRVVRPSRGREALVGSSHALASTGFDHADRRRRRRHVGGARRSDGRGRDRRRRRRAAGGRLGRSLAARAAGPGWRPRARRGSLHGRRHRGHRRLSRRGRLAARDQGDRLGRGRRGLRRRAGHQRSRRAHDRAPARARRRGRDRPRRAGTRHRTAGRGARDRIRGAIRARATSASASARTRSTSAATWSRTTSPTVPISRTSGR